MKTLEQIVTRKGCYSLSFAIRDDNSAIVTVCDPKQCINIRLDEEDLRRIRLLIEDHIQTTAPIV